MHALHLARQAIRNDECDSAIVGGCNLCLNNGITLHLQKMGIVSKTGEARVLDEAGKYTRVILGNTYSYQIDILVGRGIHNVRCTRIIIDTYEYNMYIV